MRLSGRQWLQSFCNHSSESSTPRECRLTPASTNDRPHRPLQDMAARRLLQVREQPEQKSQAGARLGDTKARLVQRD